MVIKESQNFKRRHKRIGKGDRPMDGSGPKGQSETCPYYDIEKDKEKTIKEKARTGKGGRPMDGSGPRGQSETCPKASKER